MVLRDHRYKPEHVTDLESGAICTCSTEGDHADTKALSERVACAVEVVNRIVVWSSPEKVDAASAADCWLV